MVGLAAEEVGDSRDQGTRLFRGMSARAFET
jgi:hypothetical protein